MKLFCVSDIHGHFKELIKDLSVAGYDDCDPNNLLIVCGDLFDRGEESLALYEFLKKLTDENKAIVLMGNHEDIFIDYLSKKNISPFNYLRNGTRQTFADFLHQTEPFGTWCIMNGIEQANTEHFLNWLEDAVDEINEKYPDLLPWLKSLPYYYETENHIFVHGMINGKCHDWKNPPEGWDKWIWATPSDYTQPIINTNKTIVTGHIDSETLRRVYNMDFDNYSIFTRPDGRVISLDTCTALTKRVNVLVIEDELI